MAADWEYKSVKVPSDRSGARTRALNRYARDGWELVESTRDRLRWARANTDTVTLRRPASYKTEQKAEHKRQQAERVARFDARRESRKPTDTEPTRGGHEPHEHEWVDRSSADDRRNSTVFLICGLCGQARTDPAPGG